MSSAADSTLTDRVYRDLRAKLARGELRAGQRLVNRTIARELNVSQTPLREAVNRLTSEGVLEYVPGAGAYVRRIDAQDLLQLYDLREHIEPFAASLAARHATPPEIQEMQMICDDWLRLARQIREQGAAGATADQMRRWNDNEERFHTLLFEASRNRWLIATARNLRLLSMAFAVQRETPQLLGLWAAATTWRDHLRIVRALRRQDASRAEQLVRRHVAAGRSYVLSRTQLSEWRSEK